MSETNPPLFQMVSGMQVGFTSTEITLRELFAMAALAGEMARPESLTSPLWETAGALASAVYRTADAMLAERAKGKA